ncbi:MAG: hypothetical protein KF819_33055 [Labilithrix sp.]|nr:hypothetical protein [Labilithrix sp.]
MTQPGYPPYGGPPSQYPGYAHTANVPPLSGGAAIPPAPPAPKKSALPFILGGAGAAFVLLAAVGGGIAYWKLRSRSVALPVDAKMLPALTSEVGTQLIEATRETDEHIRRAYLASELGSELCRAGAADPARRIEGIGGGTSRAAKEFFFDKRNIDSVQSLLECGAMLGGSLDSPYQAVISVAPEADAKPGIPQRIAVGHFKITELPQKYGFTRYTFKGVPGFCRTRPEDRGGLRPIESAPSAPGTCEEFSLGAFAQGTTWFLGNRNALETMATSVKKPRDELNPRIAALKDAAGETEGLPVVRIQTQPKSSREFFMSPCYFGASHSAAPFTAFLEGCFPAKGQERLIEEIDSKIKAAAYESDGDPQKAKAFHGNIIFVARDDGAAKDVEADVREIVTEWRSHVEENDAKLINQSNELATTARQKKFAAVADTYFRALKSAKVSRKGRTVRVSFREALSKDDLAALEDADKKTAEKREATAEILDAIQAKRPVPIGPLTKLVGPSWARFLTGPAPVELPPSPKTPLSEADCKRLQARIAPFTSTSFFTTDAKLQFFAHKFANCATRPPEVDAAQRTCLATFTNAGEYARCASNELSAALPPGQPPDSEFGDRRLKK